MLLVRWYDHTKWLLERVDSFPKNQRFIFGTRLADTTLDIMELLIEASYTRHKAELLHRAKRSKTGHVVMFIIAIILRVGGSKVVMSLPLWSSMNFGESAILSRGLGGR